MKYLVIILIVFPFLSIGQVNSKIEQAAQQITGTWLLERYEYDSLLRTQEIIGDMFVEKTFVLGDLTKKEESEGGYIIELSFKPNGRGSYQEYYEYRLESQDSWIEINTCQPVPELRIKDNQIFIHMTYMMDEGIESVAHLTANSLELLGDSGMRRTFKRLK